MLFASTWLFAAALVFAAAGRTPRLRVSPQSVALVLCAFGVLLRPNALTRAVLCATSRGQRDLLEAGGRHVRARHGCVLSPVQFVYYGVLGATRQHPLQSIMVFDLGGISHFAGENQYPVTWTPAESKLLLDGCYRPTEWDIYWRIAPCEFVMHKLEKDEKIFGTPAVQSAWAYAVFRHPVAYLEHRAGFMWNFLAGANLTMWVADVERPDREVFSDRPAFVAFKRVHDVLKPTPLFRAGTWLVGCIAVCGSRLAATRDRGGRLRHWSCATAAVYVATFFAVGVASDFRYGYLAVLATIAGWSSLAPTPRSA